MVKRLFQDQSGVDCVLTGVSKNVLSTESSRGIGLTFPIRG